MSAIERCRTAALGGHVARCEDCAHAVIAYNSCRNRHCPKSQGAAAKQWLAERQAELLPRRLLPCRLHVAGAHRRSRLPQQGGHLRPAVQGLRRDRADDRADPKHLGALIGITAVLHTWGSTMTHHPHIHMIVPGGGVALDGKRWPSSSPKVPPPRGKFSRICSDALLLQKLRAAHKANQLQFFGQHAHLAEPKDFAAYSAPLRKIEWYLYVKPPFGGPEAVLAYLSPYTHRIAIANSRLIAFNENGVTFRYKDYRADGRARYKTMTLATDEFIRRFLIHILPHGFHRIRHYGLFANGNRATTTYTRPRFARRAISPKTSRDTRGHSRS